MQVNPLKTLIFHFLCLFSTMVAFCKKRCENTEKDHFNQPMACEAPVCWSKSTTLIILGVVALRRQYAVVYR